jgi:hypothetical protein
MWSSLLSLRDWAPQPIGETGQPGRRPPRLRGLDQDEFTWLAIEHCHAPGAPGENVVALKRPA